MRFSGLVLTALQAASVTAWFGSNAIYNKWHQTELERFLEDHNIPFPQPADRKNYMTAIQAKWDDYVVQPYKNSWDTEQLVAYLKDKGEDVQTEAYKNKQALVDQVQITWADTEEKANTAYGSIKDWIFDSWSESQLKSFCDYHGIPVPQPKTRDSYLQSARSNYQTVANKLNEYAAYPSDWVWAQWSDSDLKAWCDERAITVPQNGSRDKLIAAVRRNSRSASQSLSSAQENAAAWASDKSQAVNDAIFDSWSQSQLKKWADERGLKVPQGSKRNEMIALIRHNNAQLQASAAKSASSVSGSAVSAYGAATSSAGNQYAKASHSAALNYLNAQDAVGGYWAWLKSQVGMGVQEASVAAASASKAGASAGAKATKKAKDEL